MGESLAQAFSCEFCEILKNTNFVTYQRLLLNPGSYNTKSLEAIITIVKILKHIASISLFEEQLGYHEYLLLSFQMKLG